MNRQDLEALRAAADEAEQAYAQAGGPTPGEWTQIMVPLTVGILIFGLVVLLLMSYVLLRSNRPPISILRAFCVPLIIVAALVLVIAGYTQDQIAPVIGLLGSIAGYLLGKSDAGGPEPPIKGSG